MGALVWGYLRGIFPQTATPKQIASHIREKQGTVRKEMVRLEESGHIVKVANGWYRAFADPDLWHLAEKPEPCVHGLQIKAVVPLERGSLVPRGARQATLATAGGQWKPDTSNDCAIRQDWVMGRSVSFHAYGTGTIMVNISASRDPVKFADWPLFLAELKGLCRGMGIDLDSPTSQLVNVEFNADWRSIVLDGMKRLKMGAVSRAWGQIYQKHRDALRTEIRVSPPQLSMKEAAAAIIFMVEGRAFQPAPPPGPALPATEPAPYGQEVA